MAKNIVKESRGRCQTIFLNLTSYYCAEVALFCTKSKVKCVEEKRSERTFESERLENWKPEPDSGEKRYKSLLQNSMIFIFVSYLFMNNNKSYLRQLSSEWTGNGDEIVLLASIVNGHLTAFAWESKLFISLTISKNTYSKNWPFDGYLEKPQAIRNRMEGW